MTRTDIANKIRRQLNIHTQSDYNAEVKHQRQVDFLIDEIARLQYQINGLRGLNLAQGEFRLSVTGSNPHQFISPEDLK